MIVLLFYREEAANLAAQVWSALFYVTNWYFIISEQSYFALVERPPVFQHLWSLAIEEQFYLVWPLALLGLLKLFGNRRRAMALVIFGGAALSLIWMSILFEPAMDPSRAYYGTDTRASGLLMGAALALLWRPIAVVEGRPGSSSSVASTCSAWAPSSCSPCASCGCRSSTRSSTTAASPSCRSPRCW